MITMRFLGWEQCDFSDYKQACYLYGFNSESSPEFIEFFRENGAVLDFYCLVKKGEVIGAVCVDNGWLCNDIHNRKSQTNHMPIPHYSVTPPFKTGTSCIIPFRSKCLSVKNFHVRNASFNLLSKRRIAISKTIEEFSAKTVSCRKRELRKFLAGGGSFLSNEHLTADELYDIYHHLFSLRRSREFHNCETEREFFRRFKDNFIGEVAFLRGEPVAVQLNISSISHYGMFVDFINIGYDVTLKEYSLGTLVMWNNLNFLENFSRLNQKSLIYSFGMMSGAYKDRWCNPANVGRIIA